MDIEINQVYRDSIGIDWLAVCDYPLNDDYVLMCVDGSDDFTSLFSRITLRVVGDEDDRRFLVGKKPEQKAWSSTLYIVKDIETGKVSDFLTSKPLSKGYDSRFVVLKEHKIHINYED